MVAVTSLLLPSWFKFWYLQIFWMLVFSSVFSFSPTLEINYYDLFFLPGHGYFLVKTNVPCPRSHFLFPPTILWRIYFLSIDYYIIFPVYEDLRIIDNQHLHFLLKDYNELFYFYFNQNKIDKLYMNIKLWSSKTLFEESHALSVRSTCVFRASELNLKYLLLKTFSE